jgi:hypothetical protein
MRTLRLTSAPGFLIALIFCLSSLVACKNDGTKNADANGDDDKDYAEYKRYITYTRDSAKASNKSWEEIDREYNAKKAAAAKDMDKWNAERKAEYEKLNAEYEAWKTAYLAEREAQEKHWTTFGPIYGTVYITAPDAMDMTLPGVTGENVAEVYKNFIQVLKANKNQYTMEDWNEIEKLWEALEDKKDALPVTAGDKTKIAGWKTEYVSVKAVKKDDKTSDKK